MKLLVLSDLHLEFIRFQVDEVAAAAADVVVLAGDIHKGTQAIDWMAREFGGKPVVYVAGNHEFYGGHWQETLDALRRESKLHGIHFLEDDEVVIGDCRFLGCSLWTDFRVLGDERLQESMGRYKVGMNDCRLIGSGRGSSDVSARRLTPGEVLQRHLRSREWLLSRINERHEGSTIVVTHHLPSTKSVPQRYEGDPLSPGFASNLPETCFASVDLWIHGHTHDSADYVIQSPVGNTRVICNPRGYPLRGGFENPEFRRDLLIEV